MPAVVFALAALLAADEATHYALTTTLNVYDVITADITGDGHADILALCSDEKSSPLEKHAAFFPASAAGVFATAPALTIPLPPESGACFLAQVDGENGPDLVVTHTRGAEVFSFAGGTFAKLGASEFFSLLPSGSKEPRFLNGLAHDLDGDGIDEWIIPVPMGAEIRTLEGRKAVVTCDVNSEARSSATSAAVSISHRVPGVFPFPIDGAAEHSLAFLTDEFADFAHGTRWTDHTRFKIPVNLEEKWDTNAQMHDVSGNGLPDLVVTQTQGTINVTVLTQIYLAEQPYAYPDTPTATFETKGAFATPVIIDVNRDGKLDVLYIKVPFGVNFFANLLIRRKVAFKVEVYLFKDGGFAALPDYTSSLTIDAPDGRQEVAYTFGDFNGDGRVDAALGSGNEQLVVHLGEEKRLIAAKPWLTFPISPFGTAKTVDLNGNPRDDFLLFHPSGDQKKIIDILVF